MHTFTPLPRIVILKPRFNRRGPYYQVNLALGGGHSDRKTFTVHRLMALTFLGPRPEGYQINHKDGDKLNNRRHNLEYVTARENTRHAMALGLFNPQLNSGNGGGGSSPKLSTEQVLTARVRHQQGESCAAIGRSLGVSDRTICSVVHMTGAYTN